MSTFLESLVGPMPSPDKLEYFRWEDGARTYIRNYCPRLRETVYYVDFTAGNDANTGLSTGQAWKTIAKVQATITAWTPVAGGITFLFKRDEIWETTVWLDTLDKDNISFSDYGAGKYFPFFNAFANKFASGGSLWTLASGARYTTTVASIGTIRRQLERMREFTKAASTAEVEATPNSWFWAANTLSLHITNSAGVAVDPDTVALEYTLAGTAAVSGINISANSDGCHVSNIRFDGQGYVGYEDGQQAYGARSSVNGTNIAYIGNVACYYHNRHNVGSNTGGSNSNVGGLTLFENISIGKCWEQGNIPAISYAGGGQQEAIWYNLTIIGGAVRDSITRDYPTGTGFYCHCNSGGYNPALMIMRNLYIPKPLDGYSVAAPAAYGDLPAQTTLANCRFIEIGTVTEPTHYGVGNGWTPWIANVYYANRKIFCQPRNAGGTMSTQSSTSIPAVGGWERNGIHLYDWRNIPAALVYWAIYNPTLVAQSYPDFGHMNFLFFNPNRLEIGFNYDQIGGGGTANAAGTKLRNSIMQMYRDNPDVTAAPTMRLTLVDTADALQHNAYIGLTAGTSPNTNGHANTLNAVNLGAYISQYSQPAVGSPLDKAGIGGICEYDHNLQPRDYILPTIGPYEVYDPTQYNPSIAELQAAMSAELEDLVNDAVLAGLSTLNATVRNEINETRT
jgi:hypothetical protein